jgi:hypothetical protein
MFFVVIVMKPRSVGRHRMSGILPCLGPRHAGMGPSPCTRMRTEGATTGEELVFGVVTLVLFLAPISPLRPSPPGGPRPTVPYARGPAWDDDGRPESECNLDDC